MTILSFLCRLIPGSRCADEPPRPETAGASTDADLGQGEAEAEAMSKEQLRDMEGGLPLVLTSAALTMLRWEPYGALVS